SPLRFQVWVLRFHGEVGFSFWFVRVILLPKWHHLLPSSPGSLVQPAALCCFDLRLGEEFNNMRLDIVVELGQTFRSVEFQRVGGVLQTVGCSRGVDDLSYLSLGEVPVQQWRNHEHPTGSNGRQDLREIDWNVGLMADKRTQPWQPTIEM